MNLLDSQLRCLFPEFIHNLHSQSHRERGMSRAAVIEYHQPRPYQEVFKSSRDLQSYFEKTSAELPSKPRQRLFLLEDLSFEHVLTFGSQLRIPPSFFGAHWADPTTPNFNYRSPFCRYADHNFVIRYATTQPLRVDAAPDVYGTIFRFDANVDRHVHCYNPKGPLVDQPKSYQVLSFWTSGVRGDGSWDCKLFLRSACLED